jgi:flagellar basal-body rod modification protein FlgD
MSFEVRSGVSPVNVGSAAQSGSAVDAYQRFQAQYGEKPQKAREVKKTLGKDDFLKIMLSQMKNQDPLNPFKSDQMGTQIAQFTSVEQLQNMNQTLGKMTNQNKPLENLAITQLIGKQVTVDRDRFEHHEGQTDTVSFHLPQNAATVVASLISDTGEEVYRRDIGQHPQGDVSFNWDGIRSNTLPAKSGHYRVQVEAKDDSGRPVTVDQRRQTQVVGVSFEGAEPVLLVGDSNRVEKIGMRNVVKIELPSLGGAEANSIQRKGGETL